MTTEQMDVVDAEQIAAETHQGGSAPVRSAKRPPTSDRKPKAKKAAKPKVKNVMGSDADGNKVPVGREVTLHGVTVTVLDSALGDFQTADDMSLLAEASEHVMETEENERDVELLMAASARVSPMLRRLVGIEGSQAVLRTLRRENGGELSLEHASGFLMELVNALSKN